ncbi:MAG: ParB family transcriptional regulator, chromosome partitioning protein [Candidatus Binatota bacterium]|nr:ParB family transcriptional regulator, chromosome partitioning protein [Candidatus Binatota bacterium]
MLSAASARVVAAGGAVAGAYREPLSGSPILLAVLPLDAVEPTPFQRDLSPAHTKRLAEKIEECGAFLDPIVTVPAPGPGFWTPNGRHRLAAARSIGLRAITALVCSDSHLAYRILALNTEKAHNLKDRSLEAIRMARSLAETRRDARETDFRAELESASLVTLGLAYEHQPRFSGGAYLPVLRKVDRFADGSLRSSLRTRGGWAARLLEVDARVSKIVAALQARGFRSPYLRAFVVARINPVRWVKPKKGEDTPAMSVGEAITRMSRAARDLDVTSIRERDLAAAVVVVAPEE